MVYSVFVRYLKLPCCVEAIVLPNADDTYDVYINTQLCCEKRQAVINHEMEHIKKNHLYDEVISVAIAESEAGSA